MKRTHRIGGLAGAASVLSLLMAGLVLHAGPVSGASSKSTSFCVAGSPDGTLSIRSSPRDSTANITYTLLNGDCGIVMSRRFSGVFVYATFHGPGITRSGWMKQRWLVPEGSAAATVTTLPALSPGADPTDQVVAVAPFRVETLSWDEGLGADYSGCSESIEASRLENPLLVSDEGTIAGVRLDGKVRRMTPQPDSEQRSRWAGAGYIVDFYASGKTRSTGDETWETPGSVVFRRGDAQVLVRNVVLSGGC